MACKMLYSKPFSLLNLNYQKEMKGKVDFLLIVVGSELLLNKVFHSELHFASLYQQSAQQSKTKTAINYNVIE